MAEGQGYIGRSPGDSAVIIASQTFEPTGIQTNFTFASGYDPGYIDVYLNGARLIYANDYTATDGSTVALVDSALNGDVLECVAYKAFNVATIDSAPGNLTVGNKLTVSGVTTATSAYYTGIVTASSFSGDGSALTGVASTDNIITSTASTFTGNVWVGAAISISGISTVYNDTQSTSTADGALVVYGGVGIAKSLHVGGNVTVGGTLTYEDVTNQDVLGLSTFRSGVQFGVAGVGGTIRSNGDTTLAGVITATTFSGDVSGGSISLPDNKSLFLGGDDDLEILHTAGANSYIKNNTGEFEIRSDTTKIFNKNTSQTIAGFTQGASVGITTVGILTAYSDVAVGSAISMYASSGIVSATAFYGDGSQLEGVSASGGSSLDITSCLFI
tara:strand:- start:90 stop:1250 length:1161 start_codon:yes stop_codon:yes gene_type:complete